MDTNATAMIDYRKNQSWPFWYSSILIDGGLNVLQRVAAGVAEV